VETSDGNPAAQLAQAVGWERGAAELIEALVGSGWLDNHRRHGLLVHDWPEHAEDAVHMSLARRGVRFADGTMPTMRRFSEKTRQELRAKFRAHTKRTPSAPAVAVAVALPSPPKPFITDAAVAEVPATERRDGPPANALVKGKRPELEAECLALVRTVAAARKCDPTEVMAECGAWNGRRQVNPASMSDDRLLNTVLDLRRMAEGKTARPPPGNPRAQEREETAKAAIRGGLRDERSMGQGNGTVAGELARPGPDTGDGGGARRLLPPASRPPRR
jgi:hypothetical protein